VPLEQGHTSDDRAGPYLGLTLLHSITSTACASSA
jgi:hypothetical protein